MENGSKSQREIKPNSKKELEQLIENLFTPSTASLCKASKGTKETRKFRRPTSIAHDKGITKMVSRKLV